MTRGRTTRVERQEVERQGDRMTGDRMTRGRTTSEVDRRYRRRSNGYNIQNIGNLHLLDAGCVNTRHVSEAKARSARRRDAVLFSQNP
jgi:hypothetical protein